MGGIIIYLFIVDVDGIKTERMFFIRSAWRVVVCGFSKYLQNETLFLRQYLLAPW